MTKPKRNLRASGNADPRCLQLDIAEIKWEFEDELPGMQDDEFDCLFQSSRIVGNDFGGVRMYPYVVIGGQRVWIAGYVAATSSADVTIQQSHSGFITRQRMKRNEI